MKKKKGISLIVLIITIIVVIILAVTVILTITKNNPIESAKEAVFKEDVRAFQDELNMYISNEYTRLQGQRDIKITAKKYEKNGGKDSVYTYIPDFKKKYEGKLAIKDDMIAYVGSDAKEKEWLLNSGVYIAKTLTVKYVDQDGNKLKEDESIALMDNYYSVDVPEIEGYIRFSEKLEGKISQDSEVIAEYYLENDNLAFMGLDASGNETTDEASIVSYEVTGIGECNVSKIAIPRKHNGKPVTKIKARAFYGNSNLISVIVEKNINFIGNNAFSQCDKMVNVSIDADKMDYSIFLGDKELETVIINKNVSNWNFGIFSECDKLVNLSILSEKVSINNSTLGNPKSLKEVKINDENEKYKFEDGLVLSKDGKKIYACLITKEEDTYNFSNEIDEIGPYAFFKCNNLKYIYIPENVNRIGERAFGYCSNLKEIRINSNSLCPLTFIGDDALETAVFGKNVQRFDYGIFSSCNNIKNITYLGTMDEWSSTLGKTNSWKNGNTSITKIICSDGEISL